MKPKVISIITQKGGVGKTTSTIHIGGALAKKGYKVLLIDFDTQTNLSLGYDISDYTYTVEEFIKNPEGFKCTKKGYKNNVCIIPGSSEIKEKSLNKNSLKKAIENLPVEFDFVIIDCPPKPINDELSFGEIAITASDFVISPIRADKYSLAGIGAFLKSVKWLKERSALKTVVLGFFFNEVEEKTVHFRSYYQLLSESDASRYLFKKFIRKDVDVKNAMDMGQTIFDISPNGRAAFDFERLTEELLTKINK